jgi:hypothetical protein
VIREALTPAGQRRTFEPLRCDGVPKHMLDIDAMRTVKADDARSEWAQWRSLAARQAPALTLDEMKARHGDLDEARRAFRMQPLVREFDGLDPDPSEHVLIEPAADNTSENIALSRHLLRQDGIEARSVMLMSRWRTPRRA